MMFLDDHGGLWVVCDPNHPHAEAFGPCEAARPLWGSVAGGEVNLDDFSLNAEGWFVCDVHEGVDLDTLQ